MTSEGLGEMFEAAGKFPLVPMGDRAEGLACADPGARTPISMSGNLIKLSLFYYVAALQNFDWCFLSGNVIFDLFEMNICVKSKAC